MDTDIAEIRSRIREQFDLGHHTLFWEDVASEYADAVNAFDLGDGAFIDASGSELAAKRVFLKDRPAQNIVIYRAGEAPRPEDDFLYDIKLSATPFSCKMEAAWASECGVPAVLSETLVDHSKFFNSKERRARLAETRLDKGTGGALRLALLASCAGSRAENSRDAVRDVVGKLLAELGRGQDKTLKLIVECGLGSCLWAEISRVVGYTVETGAEPSVEDLAFKMILARCGNLVSSGVGQLGADAIRILSDLASSSRTRSAYDALVSEYGGPIAEMVDVSLRTMEGVGSNDTLPIFDEWVISDMLSRAAAGTLRAVDARGEMSLRAHTLWYSKYKDSYEAIASALDALEGIELYCSGCTSKTTTEALFNAYRNEWYQIDCWYRHFVNAMHGTSGRFGRLASALADRVSAAYHGYLSDLADRWQAHLMDAGVYPPLAIPSQGSFFEEKVIQAAPKAEDGLRIGVIISDAMRFEIGAELAMKLNAGELSAGGRVQASCEALTCMLPSYTQLGMAALLPKGAMEIVLKDGAVLKDGRPTSGLDNRRKIVEASVPGAVTLRAPEVLESGLPSLAGAPLVVIYHNTIDKRGDSRDTESEVFEACEEAIEKVASIAGELLRAGCGRVLVTADHGFLYQDQPIEESDFAEEDALTDVVEADGMPLSYGRRFVVGLEFPKSDVLLEYSSTELSLEGDYRVVLPRGIARLRLRGSGARYVHGGASLQEDVVPVVTVERAGRAGSSERTGVQGFLSGRPTITGATALLDVYQMQPCSEKVSPLTVKVGLYDPDDGSRLLCSAERMLELDSTAMSSEERKTRVELRVTDDVDDYSEVILRISSRIGNTNQFRPEWEQRLSVSRAFGNDFDF